MSGTTPAPPYATMPLDELRELWRNELGWAPCANTTAWLNRDFRNQFELFAFTPDSGIVGDGARVRAAAINAGRAGLPAFSTIVTGIQTIFGSRGETREIARQYTTASNGEALLIVLTFDAVLDVSDNEIEKAFGKYLVEPMQAAFNAAIVEIRG